MRKQRYFKSPRSKIEVLLAMWGECVATPVHGLGHLDTTVEGRMMTRPRDDKKRLEYEQRRRAERARQRELENRLNEDEDSSVPMVGNPKQTRVVIPTDPRYRGNAEFSRINRCIGELPSAWRLALTARWVLCYPKSQAAYYARMSARDYSRALRDACLALSAMLRLNIEHYAPAPKVRGVDRRVEAPAVRVEFGATLRMEKGEA